MSFQISPELDANKVFLVRSSELEGRLDPNFYRPYLSKFIHKIENKVENLGNIARFSNEIWDQESLFEKEFPYLEIGEIDLSTGEINKLNHIMVNEAPSRARMIVRKGDILISTTRPGRGAISFFENDKIIIASTGFSVVRSVVNEVNRRYLFLCLRQDFSLQQMEQRSSGGNYPAITQEELKK